MAGLVLDLLAGILTLVAVNVLPLFLVQAVIASCVVMTALLERWFFKRKLRPPTYLAALVVMLGLACVGLAAQTGPATTPGPWLQTALRVSPLALAVLGGVAISLKGRGGYLALGILSGAAFGSVSIIGRVLVYPVPLWHIFINPLIWVIIANGALGMYFFTAALQRTLATIANGVMISAETIVPIVAGVIFLGDTARGGLWPLVWAGCTLVVAGCGYIAFTA